MTGGASRVSINWISVGAGPAVERWSVMQHEVSRSAPTLDYAAPPPKPRTRVALVAALLGLVCLILETVNEIVTVVPSKGAEQARWQAGYVLLFLAGALFGFSLGVYFAQQAGRRAV